MFYCDECAIKKGWNMTFAKSFGPCEVCNKTRECSGLPSNRLTNIPSIPSKKLSKKPYNSI